MALATATLFAAARTGAQAPTETPTAAPTEALPVDEVPEEPPLPRYRVDLIVFQHTDGDPNEEIFEDDPAGGTGLAEGIAAPEPEDVIAVETFGTLQPTTSPESDAEGPAGLTTEFPAPGPDELAFIDPFGRPIPLAEAPEPGAVGAFTDGTLGAGTAVPPGAITDGAEDSGLHMRILRSDELELDDAYAIMDRLGAYRVLAYGGWVQDGLDESVAQPVDLASIGVTNPRGTVRLYLGRYLHLSLDLEFRMPPAPTQLNPYRLSEIGVGKWYRLKTERNAIRSGELHYIDHPLFGVLVLITPAPEEEEPLEDDTAILQPAA